MGKKHGWLLHIDEPTRVLALDVIRDVAEALASKSSSGWTVRGERGAELVLPRSVHLHGAKRAARLTVRNGVLSLSAPANGAAMRQQFGIFDGRAGQSVAGLPNSLAPTLDEWIAGLSDPVDDPTVERSAAFRRSVAKLGLGVIERAGINWDWFEMRAASAGRHSMTIAPTGRRKGETVSIDRGPLAAGRMTNRLSDELDALIGDGGHVSEGHARRSDDMPSIMIGRPCGVRVQSDDETALSRMRAIAAVPAGAAILFDGD